MMRAPMVAKWLTSTSRLLEARGTSRTVKIALPVDDGSTASNLLLINYSCLFYHRSTSEVLLCEDPIPMISVGADSFPTGTLKMRKMAFITCKLGEDRYTRAMNTSPQVTSVRCDTKSLASLQIVSVEEAKEERALRILLPANKPKPEIEGAIVTRTQHVMKEYSCFIVSGEDVVSKILQNPGEAWVAPEKGRLNETNISSVVCRGADPNQVRPLLDAKWFFPVAHNQFLFASDTPIDQLASKLRSINTKGELLRLEGAQQSFDLRMYLPNSSGAASASSSSSERPLSVRGELHGIPTGFTKEDVNTALWAMNVSVTDLSLHGGEDSVTAKFSVKQQPDRARRSTCLCQGHVLVLVIDSDFQMAHSQTPKTTVDDFLASVAVEPTEWKTVGPKKGKRKVPGQAAAPRPVNTPVVPAPIILQRTSPTELKRVEGDGAGAVTAEESKEKAPSQEMIVDHEGGDAGVLGDSPNKKQNINELGGA